MSNLTKVNIARVGFIFVSYLLIGLFINEYNITEWGWGSRITYLLISILFITAKISLPKDITPTYTLQDMSECFKYGRFYEDDPSSNPTFVEWIEQKNLLKKK